MTNYQQFQMSLQALFKSLQVLSPAQYQRVSQLCWVVLLAGRPNLRFLARRLPRRIQQASRMRWLRRTLSAAYMRPEFVYEPALQKAWVGLKLKRWHLVIDRTAWLEQDRDLVTVALAYRKRAIPICWIEVTYGGAASAVYVDLLKAAARLVPAHASVIVHGDREFGSLEMIRALRELGWDFILSQSPNTQFRQGCYGATRAFRTLRIPQHGTLKIANIELTKQSLLAGLNCVAFRAPQRDRWGHQKRDVLYLVTSLPLTQPIRRLGRRRWGIEPFHRDFKSAGWQLTQTQPRSQALRQGLLTVMALCYLLSVGLGVWLSKRGQRRCVDSHRKRHYSFFTIGWDFIIHSIYCGDTIPFRLRLYQ